MIKTEWNEAGHASVRVTTVRDLAEESGYELHLEQFDEDDDLDYPVLIIEGDGGLGYIVTGDLDAFARKVVEAVHG